MMVVCRKCIWLMPIDRKASMNKAKCWHAKPSDELSSTTELNGYCVIAMNMVTLLCASHFDGWLMQVQAHNSVNRTPCDHWTWSNCVRNFRSFREWRDLLYRIQKNQKHLNWNRATCSGIVYASNVSPVHVLVSIRVKHQRLLFTSRDCIGHFGMRRWVWFSPRMNVPDSMSFRTTFDPIYLPSKQRGCAGFGSLRSYANIESNASPFALMFKWVRVRVYVLESNVLLFMRPAHFNARVRAPPPIIHIARLRSIGRRETRTRCMALGVAECGKRHVAWGGASRIAQSSSAPSECVCLYHIERVRLSGPAGPIPMHTATPYIENDAWGASRNIRLLFSKYRCEWSRRFSE